MEREKYEIHVKGGFSQRKGIKNFSRVYRIVCVKFKNTPSYDKI